MNSLDELLADPAALASLAIYDGEGFEAVAQLLEAELLERERAFYEDSLLEFFKRAWREIDPAPLKINWHHEVICEHLEQVMTGQIRKLLINVPPGSTKTNLCSVIFPCFIWAQPDRGPLSGPQTKFMTITYGDALSKAIARLSRRLLMSAWFQTLWGHRVKLNADQSGLEDMGNQAGGFRIATSIGGATLGRRGDLVIIDDAHKVAEVESAIERENVIRAYDEAIATRVTDPATAAEIVIMQRLHQDDLSGHVLDKFGTGFHHVMLPMEFDAARACPADPRQEDGALLWPEQWDKASVETLKLRLGPFAAAGQLQQMPVPRGGGIIAVQDWRVYPESPPDPTAVRRHADGTIALELPDLSYVLITLDTALSERETADWNACIVFGVWHRRKNDISNLVGMDQPWFSRRWSGARDEEQARQEIIEDDNQPRVILCEAWRRRCPLNSEEKDKFGKPVGLVQRVVDTARRRRADRILIENKTRGIDVANEIRRQVFREEFQVELFEPRLHGDKVARLYAVQPLFSQGLVYSPGNYTVVTRPDGSVTTEVREEFIWCRAVMDEVMNVPRGRHDDLADCVSMGLLWLRNNGFLELTQEYLHNTVQEKMRRSKRALGDVARLYGVA